MAAAAAAGRMAVSLPLIPRGRHSLLKAAAAPVRGRRGRCRHVPSVQRPVATSRVLLRIWRVSLCYLLESCGFSNTRDALLTTPGLS